MNKDRQTCRTWENGNALLATWDGVAGNGWYHALRYIVHARSKCKYMASSSTVGLYSNISLRLRISLSSNAATHKHRAKHGGSGTNVYRALCSSNRSKLFTMPAAV